LVTAAYVGGHLVEQGVMIVGKLRTAVVRHRLDIDDPEEEQRVCAVSARPTR